MRNSVREHRKALGLTQYELAKLVGLTRRGILTLEKGETEPRLGNVVKLACILKVPINQLFEIDAYAADWKRHVKDENLIARYGIDFEPMTSEYSDNLEGIEGDDSPYNEDDPYGRS